VYEVYSSLFLPEKEMDYWLCGSHGMRPVNKGSIVEAV